MNSKESGVHLTETFFIRTVQREDCVSEQGFVIEESLRSKAHSVIPKEPASPVSIESTEQF